MNIDEKTIIRYFDIIVKELDDVSFFSVNNILIDNKHLEIKTQKEKDYLIELSDKVKTFGVSRGYFLKNGDNGWLKLTEKGINLKDSKKKFKKGSNQKFEWTYDGIISYFKNNKIVAIFLVLIVVFFGATKLINEFSKAKENLEKINGTSEKTNEVSDTKKEILSNEVNNVIPKVIDSLKLPYLKNVPIFDKGIFLRYNYNDLVIGGANIDSIKINARTFDGETIKFREYDGKLELDITQQPYIELEYKGSNYSVEILGKHYSFDCILTKDIVPTLNLIEVN